MINKIEHDQVVSVLDTELTGQDLYFNRVLVLHSSERNCTLKISQSLHPEG